MTGGTVGIDGNSICIGGAGAMSCVEWTRAAIYLGAVIALLALVLGVLLWDALRTTTPSRAAARANRHATLASTIGVVVMVVLLTWVFGGVALGVWPRDGRVLAVLPALAGASLLVAQAVGQLTWPRPSGAHREAELVSRTVADVTPLWPRRMVFAWAGTALALLAVFALVADGPRSLTQGTGRFAGPIGPYPGWYYGLPMSLAIVATVTATELVLRLITLRPAVVGVSVDWDLHLRRRSAGHVTRGIQLVLAVSTAGILVAAGWVHLALGRDAYPLESGGYGVTGSPAQQHLGAGLMVLAVGVLLAGVVMAFVPLRRGQRDASAPDALAVPS
ncbi:MAG: hypothetical protein KQH57_07425 [Actinomycetales bacterium]|nr:hypothetical protein [Actinomycetales bacterium]